MSKPKAITLAPDIDRDGISSAETLVAARLDFLINGVLSAGYDRNGIATSQTPSGANAMTLDGALGIDFRDRRGIYILLYAAGADTARTFTVVGEDINGNRITEAITGPGAGLITLGSTKFYHVTSVTPDAATAGAIEVGVNGYVEFSTPQHVAIYSVGNDTADTFTPRGYDRYGVALTDSIVGATGASSSTQDANFAWVDRVTNSSASAGNVEVGVTGTCESNWHVLNYRGNDFSVGLGIVLSSGASLTYSVQHTFNNVFASGFDPIDADAFAHDTLAAQTASADGNYTNPPTAVRLQFTVFASGSAVLNVIQSGSGS